MSCIQRKLIKKIKTWALLLLPRALDITEIHTTSFIMLTLEKERQNIF